MSKENKIKQNPENEVSSKKKIIKRIIIILVILVIGFVAICLLPLLKFIGLLAILLTFIIFNFILSGDREMYLNFMVNSVLFHLILPIMYFVDWILFYEHKKIKWYYSLISVSFPVIYAIFIFIRAWILDFNPKAPNIYPYFFLNLDELGVVGVIKWIGILSLVFIIIGYTIFGLDKVKFKKNKIYFIVIYLGL